MIEASTLSNILLFVGSPLAVALISYLSNRDMSKKLDMKVGHLSSEVNGVKAGLEEVRGGLEEVRGEVKEIRGQFIEFKGELNEVKTEVKEVKGKVERIDGVLGGVITFLQTHHGKDVVPEHFGGVSTVKHHSPCTLNKKGASLAKQLDAHALVDKYYQQIAIAEDATKFQIQNVCFLFVHAELQQRVNREEREKIEEAIYEEGGDANSVLFVYCVLFRDKHLEEQGYLAPVYIAA